MILLVLINTYIEKLIIYNTKNSHLPGASSLRIRVHLKIIDMKMCCSILTHS